MHCTKVISAKIAVAIFKCIYNTTGKKRKSMKKKKKMSIKRVAMLIYRKGNVTYTAVEFLILPSHAIYMNSLLLLLFAKKSDKSEKNFRLESYKRSIISTLWSSQMR